MKQFIFTFVCLVSIGALAQQVAQETFKSTPQNTTPNNGGAVTTPKVSFVEPADGATVPSKFKVKFKIEGLKLEKAGPLKPGTGHHHLLIDQGPVTKGQVIPKDATHLHYGDAQSEAEITLPPGTHKLTLQFADGAHMSYGPEVSQTITVTVKK